MKNLLLMLTCALFAVPAVAGETLAARTVTVAGDGSVELHFPAAWTFSDKPAKRGQPPTIKLESSGDGLELLISVMGDPDPESRLDTPEKIEKLVTAIGRPYVAGSVEQQVVLRKLETKNLFGQYATFTDRKLATAAPRRGDFRYAATGAARCGQFLIVFTLLANDKSSPPYEQALAVLHSLRLAAN